MLQLVSDDPRLALNSASLDALQRSVCGHFFTTMFRTGRCWLYDQHLWFTAFFPVHTRLWTTTTSNVCLPCEPVSTGSPRFPASTSEQNARYQVAQVSCRMDALLVTRPTVSKHWRNLQHPLASSFLQPPRNKRCYHYTSSPVARGTTVMSK